MILFPFSPPVCQENANNLLWFDLRQFIYHSWNLKRHCLPRSTHQLSGTLFLGELGRSRGWRETTLSWLRGGLLWGLRFLILVGVVRCCGTHSALRTRTPCRERWDLLLDQNKRCNRRYYLYPQELHCLEDEAWSLLKHSSVLKGTVASWPIDFRVFGKKTRRARPFLFGRKGSKSHSCPSTREMSDRHRHDVEASEMGLAPGCTPRCATPGAPAYMLLISVA